MFRRKKARKGRRYPEFRPMPLGLRSSRPTQQRDYARPYGNYENKFGKIKRFSFQFRIDLSKSSKIVYLQIRNVCGRFKQNQIPLHKQGQVFSSYNELMFHTPWIKVRKVRNYEVGMSYG